MLPKSLQNLINEFSKLPGIGPKTASRLAFYLLKQKESDLALFADALKELQKGILFCSICFNMTEHDPCRVCNNINTNHNLICVVEDPMDALAMSQIDNYDGSYHVLGGVISPLDNIGPQDLKIQELLSRLEKDETTKEVIIATNPSLEGEATAMYIANLLKSPAYKHVKVTRIGRGLPMGSDLEYADGYTLTKAIEGRREY